MWLTCTHSSTRNLLCAGNSNKYCSNISINCFHAVVTLEAIALPMGVYFKNMHGIIER